MSRDRWTILRFAILGLAIAAIFFAFFKTNYLAESWSGIWIFWASPVICPRYFLFALVVDATELPIPDSALVWLIIGLINFAFYAVVVAAIVGLRRKRDESARS
jgi:hypothetical protein